MQDLSRRVREWKVLVDVEGPRIGQRVLANPRPVAHGVGGLEREGQVDGPVDAVHGVEGCRHEAGGAVFEDAGWGGAEGGVWDGGAVDCPERF